MKKLLESRLKWWVPEQLNLGAWAIFRTIIKEYGSGIYPKNKVKEWYFNYDKWLAEFNKYGGSVGDLRNVVRYKIKEYEKIT